MKFLPIAEERPVSEAIITALAEGGVRYVLGMPGGLTGPLWRALYHHPIIRAIQVREESIGALMAEAYGRFTGAARGGHGTRANGSPATPGRDTWRRCSAAPRSSFSPRCPTAALAVAPRSLSERHRGLRNLGRAHHSRLE